MVAVIQLLNVCAAILVQTVVLVLCAQAEIIAQEVRALGCSCSYSLRFGRQFGCFLSVWCQLHWQHVHRCIVVRVRGGLSRIGWSVRCLPSRPIFNQRPLLFAYVCLL